MKVSMRNMVMGCLAFTLGTLLAVPNGNAQDANGQSPSKAELQQLYMDYLMMEGYKPEVDSDGDVAFKREGKTYFIDVQENDPEFFRVVIANIWSIDSEEERAQVLVAANDSNSKTKVSKVFTVRDRVWASIDLFVARPEDFKGVFGRAMSALDSGVASFASKMRE